VSCAKMAEQIEMLFGFWTRVGRMKRRQCGLIGLCQITLTTCSLLRWWAISVIIWIARCGYCLSFIRELQNDHITRRIFCQQLFWVAESCMSFSIAWQFASFSSWAWRFLEHRYFKKYCSSAFKVWRNF